MFLKFGDVVEDLCNRVERRPSLRTAAPSIIRSTSCYEDRQDAVASGIFRSRIFASKGRFRAGKFQRFVLLPFQRCLSVPQIAHPNDRSSFSSMDLIVQSFVEFGCSGGVYVDHFSKHAPIELAQNSNRSILAGTRAPLCTWLMEIGADASQDLVEIHGPELVPGISSRLRDSLSACLSSLIRKVDDDAIVKWGNPAERTAAIANSQDWPPCNTGHPRIGAGATASLPFQAFRPFEQTPGGQAPPQIHCTQGSDIDAHRIWSIFRPCSAQ